MIGRRRGAAEVDKADVAGDPVGAGDAVVQGPHGPIPVRRYTPAAEAVLNRSVPVRSAPIVWVHGGAFVKGDLDLPETHEVALALARAGFTVITVDYRLTSIPGLSK